MDLQTRPLGRTEMEITAVGLGTWAIGGTEWGPSDDDDGLAVLRAAVERGIGWVDTAPIYGRGRAEELVARALADVPAAQRPYVFTKCGIVWDDTDADAAPVRSLRPESVRRECEASLRRLRVERLDLLQLHRPDETGVPVEESWGTVRELIAEGKVRAGGVSNFGVDLLDRCEREGPVEVVQPPFSLVRREAAHDVLPWCRERGVGVLAYSPLQGGLLTGAFDAARAATLPPDDWRSSAPEFRSPQLERNLALVDALRPIAQRHETALPVVALSWVLSWTEVSGAIGGARTPAQLDEWILAGNLRLTDEDLDEIEAALRETGAGEGPTRRPRLAQGEAGDEGGPVREHHQAVNPQDAAPPMA